jgi:hypothetical protein
MPFAMCTTRIGENASKRMRMMIRDNDDDVNMVAELRMCMSIETDDILVSPLKRLVALLSRYLRD